MRRILSILIITMVAVGVAAATPFVHGPYSGAPSDGSVVISWMAAEQVPARIEYGRQSEYEQTGTFSSWIDCVPVDSTTTTTEHVKIEALEANTAFAYRVILSTSEGDIASAVGYFVTEPAPGDTVQFAVVSDTQWQWEGENRLRVVGDAVAADPMPFDFILHAGDVVESPVSVNWDHWFLSFENMLLRAPFIPVLGNHEKGHRSYYDNFVLPPGGGKGDKRWWALHWGDVVIVGLDTTNLKAADYIAEQDWARLHLSGTEPNKFVIFHYPVFSSDAYHGDGYSYDAIFHPIFVETGVDIVFNGHAHNYERIERDGVVYLVVGGGGAVPRALADTLVNGSIVATSGYNFYTRVTASVSEIDVEIVSVALASDEAFVPTDGFLLDAFSLPESEPSTNTNWTWILAALLGVAFAGLLLVRALK